jgi:hypothetical protein
MKSLIAAAILLTSLNACSSEKLEISKAKTCVESLISAADKGDFEQVKKLSSESFNEGEPAEQRIEKLKMLKNALGDVVSMQLTDSLSEAKSGEEAKILLTYKVKHSKISSIEKYTVLDQGGYIDNWIGNKP